MKILNDKDTIIAPLTPSVGGSISVIRISGKLSIPLTAKFFSDKELFNSSGGKFYYGSFSENKKNLIDEVLILVFKSPNSFTGEDVIEINSHANPFIVDKIIQTYLKSGCRLAEAGEFSKRAFLNDKIDLIQAEAIADLISSRSELGVQNSLFQLKGRLSDKLNSIKKRIIDITSYLELDLDFTEEDIEIVSSSEVINIITTTEQEISALINSFKHSKLISKGLDVLITGKPNVGKSSLMNAFLGTSRAIVSDQPGTTRDIIHEQMLIENILVRFTDSAGIHLTSNSIEAEGIERAREFYNQADILLLTLDVSEEFTPEDINLIKALSGFYKEKTIFLANKCDKPINSQNKNTIKNLAEKTLYVSAKTEEGLETVRKEIIAKAFQQQSPAKDELLITNQRQHDGLVRTKEALFNARKTLESDAGNEFAALDMRAAIDAITEITGEITTDEILNNLFSHFCTGK